MSLRTRKVKFTVGPEDHKEIEKEDLLTERFFAKGTEIKGKHSADKEIYTYTLSGTQFPYKKLSELQQDFPTLRFKTLSDKSWLDSSKEGFLKPYDGKFFPLLMM